MNGPQDLGGARETSTKVVIRVPVQDRSEPHDLGGRDMGPVAVEADEPTFHADWEKRALAITLAAGACGLWTIDESRFARETLPGYLDRRYYDIWSAALTRLLAEHGMMTPSELEAGVALTDLVPVRRVLRADQVASTLARGGPCDRPATAPAAFSVGDPVQMFDVEQNPRRHTRLPAYASARRGVIEAVRGVFVFPDTNAHGEGEQPQWLYTVRFTAQELWGDAADERDTVSIDAFEPYLDAQPSS